MIRFTSISSSSAGNCYHLTDGDTVLLLECGVSPVKIRKALNFKMSGVSGCLITHEHGDHAKAAKDLLKSGTDIYTSKGTAEAIGISGHRVHVVETKKQFRIGTWTVLPFETIHDAAEPLGFLLANRQGDKLLFLTDSAYTTYRFQGLTHIAIECNYYNKGVDKNIANGSLSLSQKRRLLKSHFSLDDVVSFLGANDLSIVKEIHLLHLSAGNSDEVLFKETVQAATGKPVYVCEA